jgi:hypothetical protein
VVRTAGAVDSYHGAPTFTGCILWGNTTHHHNLYQILEPRVPDIQYCDLQAQQLGVGGLDHDPLLASTGVPWSNSPCIDAGDAAAASPWLPSTDLAGRARMVGRNPDMGCFEFDAVTSVPAVPSTLQIRAWPNPANPGVMVSWEQPATGPVRVTVHDLAGRKVITLVDETMPTGDRNRRWNGLDDRGRLVPSGTYHIRVTTAQSVEARTITLVR